MATSANMRAMAVRRLWDVCQLPDFRKLSEDEHARLVRTIFLFLMDGPIPDDWMARQIARLDIAEGDVATLSGRLAQIRTFAYAANRAGHGPATAPIGRAENPRQSKTGCPTRAIRN